MLIMNEIAINNIVSGTSTNLEGTKLHLILKKYINNNENVVLNVSNETPLSSSFLNSSIGVLLDEYGLNKFKSHIKFKSNKAQFNRILDYIQKYVRVYNNSSHKGVNI